MKRVKNKKRIETLLFCIVIFCSFCAFNTAAYAETLTSDINGYSILSSGGLGFGHSGLMNTDGFFNNQGNAIANSVIHISSYTRSVNYGSYGDFVGDNNFLGYYSPKTALTPKQRNDVVAVARTLKNLSDTGAISYRASGQIDFKGYETVANYHGQSNVKLITPSHITRMRCDGFVEYCYEYNNIRISGNDSSWNIAIANTANQDWHCSLLTVISPKIQAYTYMKSLVGDMNADGRVNSADARTALRISARLDSPTAYHNFVGDVDNNGVVNSADARILEQHAAKLHTGDFQKTLDIKNANINNANGYSNSTLSLLKSGAFNWFI